MDRLARDDQNSPNEYGGRLVRLKKGEKKPANARILTENEVLDMQQKIILNWTPRFEMWPFSWGLGVLGGASALTGMYVNNHLRGRLGLMHLGRLGTYVPTVGLPVLMSVLFHNFLVTNKILVGEFPCTTCAASRSGAIQSAAGGLYPIVLGPLLCVANARKYHTYNVPGITEATQLLPFFRKIMPGAGILLGLLLLNFGLGMAISERETFLFGKYLCPTSASVRDELRGEEQFE